MTYIRILSVVLLFAGTAFANDINYVSSSKSKHAEVEMNSSKSSNQLPSSVIQNDILVEGRFGLYSFDRFELSGVPLYGIALKWKSQSNYSWYVRIDSSLDEKKIDDNQVIGLYDSSKFALFDRLGVLSFGLGAELPISDQLDLFFDVNYKSLRNADTDSGFSGFGLDMGMGYTHILFNTTYIRPYVGFQLTGFSNAIIDGSQRRLDESETEISPFIGFNIGVGI